MRLSFKIVAPALALAFAACSPSGGDATAKPSATAPAVHPESGLRIIPLKIESGKITHEFKVELAATAQEQAKGLMFRTQMGPFEGMIFPHDPPRRASFWMRNTVMSLDLIFISPDHRILNIIANAVPYDETPLPSDGISAGVLELTGGRAAELGLKPGDKVIW